jgi:hypothetical protein
VDGQHIGETRSGRDQQRLPLWRSQQELATGGAGMLTREHERPRATGVNKLQASQVDDDHGPTCCAGRKRGRDGRGIHDVKLPAQHHDSLPAAVTGTQIRAEHGRALLLRQQGVVLTRRLVRQQLSFG